MRGTESLSKRGAGVHLSVRQGAEGLLQQHEADAFEVEVFGEAGGVSGPREETVGVGGGTEEGQVTLTGSL